jgi:hypothetical protein
LDAEELFAAIFAFAFVIRRIFVYRLIAVTFVEWDIFPSYIRARIRNKHPREREEHTIPISAPHQKLTKLLNTSRHALRNTLLSRPTCIQTQTT